MRSIGVESSEQFLEWVETGDGQRAVAAVRSKAWNALGIFGVPTMVVRCEGAVVYPGALWGGEHIVTVRRILNEILGGSRKVCML